LNRTIWRISQEKYEQPPLNGEGSKLYGGRWNSVGRNVVYTSATLSLATLETFVHLGVNNLQVPRIAIRAEIPDRVTIESLEPENLPSDWRIDPAPKSIAQIGDEWFDSRRTAVLAVPSVIIPVEKNYLLNPLHPDFQEIIIYLAEPFDFDRRMFEARSRKSK
jgi:RES domain-containing protein